MEIAGSETQDEGSLNEERYVPFFWEGPSKVLISANEIDYWQEIFLPIDRLPHSRSMASMISRATEIERKIRKWVTGFVDAERYPGEGWSQFATQWRTIRMFVPLQLRLCTEQVLYDLGLPWRSLVSGFKPLSETASAVQTFRK